MLVEVAGERVNQEGRKDHRPPARFRLRRPDVETAVHLGQNLGDRDSSVQQVHPLPPEATELAPTETTKRCKSTRARYRGPTASASPAT